MAKRPYAKKNVHLGRAPKHFSHIIDDQIFVSAGLVIIGVLILLLVLVILLGLLT